MSEPPSGFGLPLYEASSPNLDIVAVHGIGADRDWTWSLHGTNWLGAPDMLPHDFPNARIMAYGYASNWLGKEAMSTSLEAVAGRFLSLVHELRKDCQGRNIMFIAHCFGGIVIEKTILKALANDSAQDRTLLAHISGLVFIGTPHRGSTSAGLANIVAAIAAFLNCGHKSSILKTANRDSQMLTDTVREFAKKALRLNLRIHCFYEEKETDIGPVVRSFIPATYKVRKK
ncbi:uncharacterized protein F4822DRAFT_161347 [Hypoxylon trugodes]|uniref:uncharacterized protein n=1 Tax=Hypoxylon trugodes TaxID=326681 RepID=UPI0021919681|nr:uncharacterized protein F4822DRAFT_161347 [Hypoxylon trugodes]KAI1390696.1 hypothetical protein F4822DRAFT_161347 [Hypoxylon trugodes]